MSRTCADVHLHVCHPLVHALANARYFPLTLWLTVVSRTEAVDADIRNGAFSEKNPSIKLILVTR